MKRGDLMFRKLKECEELIQARSKLLEQFIEDLEKGSQFRIERDEREIALINVRIESLLRDIQEEKI